MEQDDEFLPDRIEDDRQPHRMSRRGRGVALLAAGLVAGGALAGAATAFGSSSSPSSTPASSSAPSGTPQPPKGDHPNGPGPGRDGAKPVRGDEKELTGAAATKAIAAAKKAVPGGTVFRVETDAGDGVYEAHVKKADGTYVTVKLDKNFVVTKIESGMGLGDPAGKGGPPSTHRGAPDGNRPGHGGPPAAPSASSAT
jgi:hypothetical protein